MTAFLVINKNKEAIALRFNTLQRQMYVNHQLVTKTIQSNLCTFAVLLIEYLISRLPPEETNNPNHQLRVDWKEIVDYLVQ